jgi:hypothetical protein
VSILFINQIKLIEGKLDDVKDNITNSYGYLTDNVEALMYAITGFTVSLLI